MLSQGSSEPAWYRVNRLLLIHLDLNFNSNQILKDYELLHFGGAQYIYLFFISYELRTVNKTADVRIVFSQQADPWLQSCCVVERLNQRYTSTTTLDGGKVERQNVLACSLEWPNVYNVCSLEFVRRVTGKYG